MRFLRLIWLDEMNLSAGKQLFFLYTSLMCFLNIIQFSVLGITFEPKNLYLEKLILLALLMSSIFSIPNENRDRYSDRITLEFGSLEARVRFRLISLSINAIMITVLSICLLSILPKSTHLNFQFSTAELFRASAASVVVVCFGGVIGVLLRNYHATSLVATVIILVDYKFGVYARIPQPWTLTSILNPILTSTNTASVLLNLFTMSLIPIFSYFLIIRLLRKINRSNLPTLRRRRRDFRSRTLPTPFYRKLAQSNRPRATKILLLITDPLFIIGTPVVLFNLVLLPIISSRVLLKTIDLYILLPLLVAQTIYSFFIVGLMMGSYAQRPESRDRDSLLLGGMAAYKSLTVRVNSAIFAATAFLPIFLALLFMNFPNQIRATIFLRSFFVLAIATYIVVALATRINFWNIDSRFFLPAAAFMAILESSLAEGIPAVIPYLPSTWFAQLAGGRSIHALVHQSDLLSTLTVSCICGIGGTLILLYAVRPDFRRVKLFFNWEVKRKSSAVAEL